MGSHAHDWLDVPTVPVENPFVSGSKFSKSVLDALVQLPNDPTSHQYLVVSFDLAVSRLYDMIFGEYFDNLLDFAAPIPFQVLVSYRLLRTACHELIELFIHPCTSSRCHA